MKSHRRALTARYLNHSKECYPALARKLKPLMIEPITNLNHKDFIGETIVDQPRDNVAYRFHELWVIICLNLKVHCYHPRAPNARINRAAHNISNIQSCE